jgi:hypothetical protein
MLTPDYLATSANFSKEVLTCTIGTVRKHTISPVNVSTSGTTALTGSLEISSSTVS